MPLGAALGVNGSGPRRATRPAKRPAKSSSSALLATTAFSHWTGLAEGGLLQPCRPRCWILADARRFAMSTDVKVRSRHRYLHDNAGIRRRMCLASEKRQRENPRPGDIKARPTAPSGASSRAAMPMPARHGRRLPFSPVGRRVIRAATRHPPDTEGRSCHRKAGRTSRPALFPGRDIARQPDDGLIQSIPAL